MCVFNEKSRLNGLTVDNLLELVKQDINSLLINKDWMSSTNNLATASAVLDSYFELLYPDSVRHIKYGVSLGGDKLTVTPMNLYTGLLLMGVNVSYEDVKGKNEFDSEFCHFVFNKNGFCVLPKTFVDKINISVIFKKDGTCQVEERKK